MNTETTLLQNQQMELAQSRLIVRWLFGLTATIIGGFMVIFGWMWTHSEKYGVLVSVVSTHSKNIDEMARAPSRFASTGALLRKDVDRNSAMILEMKPLLYRIDLWINREEAKQEVMSSMH